ncbi:Poly-beta-1,6-N-acetyl-D-glucosamine synthase [Methyloligella halotolerans]|uniref:Poly-beta-1,6-N-acetyl-D-glucosamine synthase n=1 Tax=Methyloligella halotolerans TaxID=1177755 RepID=A0A1E2S188_9HYPH|nr:glycosyltransferase [Methyloligella halotolerans]ODA68247.1 Poly-beta-1,6-N-acetyl-D-glucosamine synthase [Methyloligella halotolerans]
MSDIEFGLSIITGQSGQSVFAVFWYFLLFELPRYGIAFISVSVAPLAVWLLPSPRRAASRVASFDRRNVTVIVAGHNEADVIERCVRSLHEQSLPALEIIVVSDGSRDEMAEISARLVREGLLTRALSTDIRGGKSAAMNLAIAASRGDIIVNADADCSYDRFALANIVEPFADPTVGGVSGDIVPRNGDASLTSKMQAIEYLLTISIGKLVGNATEQVVCMSGAFSAFRRDALDDVAGFDVGGGEDLDITIRLRENGWRVVFAGEAICYTDVPVKTWTLIRQRLRWERDSVWIRYRKHRRLLLPSWSGFRLLEAFHQWDFLIFSVAAAVIFPVYLIWLFGEYGSVAIPILIAMQLAMMVGDFILLAFADLVTGRPVFAQNAVYMPAYSIYTGYFMRFVRLYAYFEELFLFGSRRDNYVPAKVRAVRPW